MSENCSQSTFYLLSFSRILSIHLSTLQGTIDKSLIFVSCSYLRYLLVLTFTIFARHRHFIFPAHLLRDGGFYDIIYQILMIQKQRFLFFLGIFSNFRKISISRARYQAPVAQFYFQKLKIEYFSFHTHFQT